MIDLAPLAQPVEEREPFVDRVARGWRQVSAAPRWGALLMLVAVAIVIAAIAAVPRTITVDTPAGAASARCGLDAVVSSYPDHAVADACRSAETSRFAVFVPAALIVFGGMIAIAVALLRAARARGRSRLVAAVDRLRASPLHTALVVIGLAGVVVAIVSLRPAVVEIPGTPFVTARCGIDAYLSHYPDSAVGTACEHAAAGHAHAFFVGIALVAVGLAGAAHLVWRTATHDSARFTLAAVLVALVLVFGGAVALQPVAVALEQNGAPIVANCGIDTYVGGHPDAAVQSACRSHFGGHAAAGGVAVVGLGVLGAAAIAWPRRRARAR